MLVQFEHCVMVENSVSDFKTLIILSKTTPMLWCTIIFNATEIVPSKFYTYLETSDLA